MSRNAEIKSLLNQGYSWVMVHLPGVLLSFCTSEIDLNAVPACDFLKSANAEKQCGLRKYSGKRVFFLWIVVLCFAGIVKAQEVSVSARTDTSVILIGDQIGFTLQAEAENSYALELPVLSDSLSLNIRVLSRIQADTTEVGTRRKIIHRYLITSFDSGLFEIPSLPFIIKRGDFSDTLHSTPVFLAVNYPPTDTLSHIFDIKPPLNVPYTLMDYLRIILPVLIILLIIYLAIRYVQYRKGKKTGPTDQKRPAEPAHVIALRELDRLKEEKLWQQGLIKEYYTRLTEIIRRYIEQRFQVPAMEQTSSEILQSMKSFVLDEDTQHALQELLTLADMVKFARELPLPDENESNMLNAYVFVNHTREGYSSVNLEENNQMGDR